MAINYFSLTLNNVSHYELSQPEWLWLIPTLILIKSFTLIIKKKHLSKSPATSFSDTSSKSNLFHPIYDLLTTDNTAPKLKTSFNILYVIVFILLVIALAQPVKVGKKLPDPPQERDITFIVDTSVSMILRDYVLEGERIDRMSLLKVVLDNFIQKLKGERMSIIVFGDHAYTLVPLTADQYLLRRMLSRVQATMAGRFNAIGEGIALAVKQATTPLKNKRKRILVLLTDADQPTGKIDPRLAAKLAKNAKLPLYTIAIGATTIAAEEKRLGGLLYSPVDLELIKGLSSITDANYYQAGSPNALKEAIQAINLHETNKREIEPQYFKEALYDWLLIISFIIFSLAQVIKLVFAQSKTQAET